MSRELFPTVTNPNELHDFNVRDSIFQEVSRANYMNAGDAITSYEPKLLDNNIFVQTGDYGNLVTSKANTSITGLGNVTFKESTITIDCKITNLSIIEGVTVGISATAIFTNINFKQDISVLGNAHFIGCVFEGGTLSNTGTTYIIGCSNKSGNAHVGVPAVNIFGETT